MNVNKLSIVLGSYVQIVLYLLNIKYMVYVAIISIKRNCVCCISLLLLVSSTFLLIGYSIRGWLSRLIMRQFIINVRSFRIFVKIRSLLIGNPCYIGHLLSKLMKIKIKRKQLQTVTN